MAGPRAFTLSKRRAAFGVALLALLWLAFAASAQEPPREDAPPIRVTGPIAKPYGFYNSRGEAAGFGVEVLRALGERLGRRIDISLTENMHEAIDIVAHGGADVVYGLTPTSERLKIFALSRPYSNTDVVLFALSDRAGEFASGNYSGLRIGVRKGGASQSAVAEIIGVTPVPYDSLEGVMYALNSGDIDLVAAPEAQWDLSIRVLHMEDHYVRIGEPVTKSDLSIGVDLRQPELLAALDGALGDFMVEARFTELREKWFEPLGFWKVKKPSLTQIAIYAFIFVLALAGMMWMRAKIQNIERRARLRTTEDALTHAKELQRKNDQLKHNHKMEKILFAVTHDLKSPIVTVRGFAGVLQVAARKADVPAMQSATERMLAGTERLTLVTDALLAFGNFGRSEISRTDIDLAKILSDMKIMLENEISDAGATLVIHKPIARLYADESQVLRLLLNLVANALRYGCPQPGMTVGVLSESNADGTILTVRDHGPGVREDLRQEVFRLFRRFGPEQEGSTGLGLAIVEKIVQKHGGQCWIEDAPGGGAAFRVSFPYRLATAASLIKQRKSA